MYIILLNNGHNLIDFKKKIPGLARDDVSVVSGLGPG